MQAPRSSVIMRCSHPCLALPSSSQVRLPGRPAGPGCGMCGRVLCGQRPGQAGRPPVPWILPLQRGRGRGQGGGQGVPRREGEKWRRANSLFLNFAAMKCAGGAACLVWMEVGSTISNPKSGSVFSDIMACFIPLACMSILDTVLVCVGRRVCQPRRCADCAGVLGAGPCRR